ncbi:putative defensin-like protein 221 [Capsella rubella]|uniref:putative defensin-like protein 221 n=1 Tax=Capsella rubella TaxID=81985 RepID=UPI000CD516A5|nr:putative defensin-like protein 221 [Capsella rubella]
MKTTFFFLTLAVLVSSCVSSMMTTSIPGGKLPIPISPVSSLIDSADEHIGHSPEDMKFFFCERCAYQCIEKKKNLFSCDHPICRCTFEDIL